MKDVDEYLTESHKRFFNNDYDYLNKNKGGNPMPKKRKKAGRKKRKKR